MKPAKPYDVKDLQKTRYHDNNRDDILHYVQTGGASNEEGLIISEKQQKLLDRWQFAAAKLREQKYSREQIAKFIIGTFQVCRDTAYRDIVNAEYVFSASAPINKNFFIQQRIEFLTKKITDAYLDNDLKAAIIVTKLEKELREWVKMYEEITPARTPRTTIYNIQNNLIITSQTPEQAFEDADEIIKQLEDGKDVL
jgi:hypothetical protein